MNKTNKTSGGRPITKIQKDIFGSMVVLTIFMTLITSSVSVFVLLNTEKKNLEDNMHNIAYTITHSYSANPEGISSEYLDALEESISNVDVISVISKEGTRIYHTNQDLIGTTYDGTTPDFENNGEIYITSDIGPSGSQRRAYAAIYNEQGEFEGFVLVVLLNQHIYQLIFKTILNQLIITVIVIIISIVLSNNISKRIKHTLWGYEPDVFSAMYSVRDTILESFEEGVIAIDYDEKILFMNKSARRICSVPEKYSLKLKDYPMLNINDIRQVLKTNERMLGIQTRINHKKDVIINYYPIRENNQTIGAICLLVDRTEYSKIAEDLSGVKFLVESMRANNHDFTNKLHVILGLVQMGANKEAAEYITNINSIQQDVISNVSKNFDDPSLSALLIGKYSKAAELNITLNIEKDSVFKRSDISIDSSDLITIVGNLIENAFDAINSDSKSDKEISVGIFSSPGAALIRVDDSGPGISDSVKDSIGSAGVTTKGENHGSGLYIIKQIIERYNGTWEYTTEAGAGSSFVVTLVENKGDQDNV